MLHRICDRVAMFSEALGLDPVVQNIQCTRAERFVHPRTLMNRDVIAWFYFCRETDDVPIGQTNAAVARRAANRTGLVGAVDADAFFVERDPHHAHRITRSRRKQMKIAAPLSMLEHFLVVTERGHLRDASHFPFANGRSRMCGADRDWVSSDQLIALKYPEHVDFGVDLNDDRR